MTAAYMNDMQSMVGNSNQKQGRTILGSNNCQGQQYVVTIPGDSNNGNSAGQHNSNIVYQQQQQVYPDYSQPGMYATISSGNYYESPTNNQIMNHGSETFIVHHRMMEGDRTTTLPHTIRAAPASVQWLKDNYEPCEGLSLPRSTLYCHYLSHCHQAKLDSMNTASFGKLIRAVFPNLKTRRLGTRGNSQYHYQGIRIKPISPLNQLSDTFMSSRMHGSNYHHHHHHPHNHSVKRKAMDETGGITDSNSGTSNSMSNGAHESAHQQQNNQDFLGDVPPGATDFGEIKILPENLPDGLLMDDVRAFETLYKVHCEGIMETIVNLQFNHIESLWCKFWRSDPSDPDSIDSETQLPSDKMLTLCKLPETLKYMKNADCSFYQVIVDVLIPDILKPIPCSLTQSIRNFAKYLTDWMGNATVNAPQEVIAIKSEVAKALAQILRRYTSLNHLAQAARAVLQNPTQVAQMLSDINKIDFTNVQEQATCVFECDPEVVLRLERDFKKVLQQQTSLEQWSVWLDGAIDSALCSPPLESSAFVKAFKKFLVNWSYYSSLVIRDLTLRSAASFGSFHLIHLLYNDYIFYLMERKVAQVTLETSISVACRAGSERPKKEAPEQEDPSKRNPKKLKILSISSPSCIPSLTTPRLPLQSSSSSNPQLAAASSLPSTLLFNRGTTCNSTILSPSSLPNSSLPTKTVTIAFGGQKPQEITRIYPAVPGSKMTLVPPVLHSSTKTILVRSTLPSSSSSLLSSVPTSNPLVLNNNIKQDHTDD